MAASQLMIANRTAAAEAINLARRCHRQWIHPPIGCYHYLQLGFEFVSEFDFNLGRRLLRRPCSERTAAPEGAVTPITREPAAARAAR